ncbi:MAG: DUF2332 family protein [Elusimicrobia bacterium]|nr:DUF2332 family protein [Elusimicrobiota bacterium]
MMELRDFASCLERQERYAAGRSAVAGELLVALRRDLERAPGAWFPRLEAAWAGRRFGPYYEAPLLLLAALQREALAGRAPDLAARLPSCGSSKPGAGRAAVELLAGAPVSFFEALAGRRLQTNEPGRAVGWLLPAAVAFLTRGTPFHLVDLGASAGLTLIGDYLPRECSLLAADGTPAGEPERLRDCPFPVLSRAGLDARPRRLAEPEDRLWLKACIWPDHAERHARFDRAAELFLKLEKDQNGPRLHEADFSAMPDWIAGRLRPHPDEGLLAFNAQATDFLDAAAYGRLAEGLARVLEPWGDRALWVELELPRGGGERHELRVRRWIGGRFESRVLAETSAHPRELRLRPGWDFLRPLAPPSPPRNTREEPARVLPPGTYRFPGMEANRD